MDEEKVKAENTENVENTEIPNKNTEENVKPAPTAREERRNKKQEADAPVGKTSRPKKRKPEKLSIDIEKIKKPAAITAAVLFLLIFAVPVIRMVNNNGNPNQPSGLLLLTDMTGYTEEDALDKIHDIGFVNIKKEYIYDQFTQNGCVVKTNHHINSELKPNEEIIVYICDKALVKEPEQEAVETSKETERTYFSMDGITVIDMAIKDNVFFAILKNNNSQAIKNIQYRIGYQNSDGSDIGENRYSLDSDFTVLPGEKFRIGMDIKNNNAYYIYVSGMTYEKVSVPDNERD